jgi:hypothetical protein
MYAKRTTKVIKYLSEDFDKNYVDTSCIIKNTNIITFGLEKFKGIFMGNFNGVPVYI